MGSEALWDAKSEVGLAENESEGSEVLVLVEEDCVGWFWKSVRLSGVREEGSGSRVVININYLFRKQSV